MNLGMPWGELALLAGALLIAGFATGLLAGMLGIGGGGILLPALFELFGALGVDDAVRIERERGHEFIPELIRAFPDQVAAVTVSKPTLEDVFIKETGHRFWEEHS